MRITLLLLLLIVMTSFQAPLSAMTCANGDTGTAPGTVPDDDSRADNTACGDGAEAIGNQSTAVGSNTRAMGSGSVALGSSADADGNFSTGLGHNLSADGWSSVAVGAFSETPGFGAVALGVESKGTGIASAALGFRAFSDQDHTIVLGAIPGVNDEGDLNEYADVAIGTTTPLAPLHIFRDNDAQEFVYLESDLAGPPRDRAMMRLVNRGGIRFQFDNEVLGTAWRFQAATGGNDAFEVTKVGSGEIEFRVDDAGNATLAGMLFENSDRNAKTNIETINPDEVLAKLAELPISEWEYKDSPGQRHVGPMAQDFRAAFGLGANDTSLATIDTSGVALASVKALNLKLETISEQNRQLAKENTELQARVSQLEALNAKVSRLESMLLTQLEGAQQLVMD